ncbi:hypothetical protein L0244_29460, partial [bacterium]|nr:hypothetical protein [bacterium]
AAMKFESSSKIQGAVDHSFVFGFRVVIFVAAGLAVASGVSARLLIEKWRWRKKWWKKRF